MSLGLLTMSGRELDRAEWMVRIGERRATQAQVAEHLGLSLRQVERLYRAYTRRVLVGRVWASLFRSMAATTSGSSRGPRAAWRWSTSTTPPAA